MRSGHRENVSGVFHQRCGQRLAAQAANVYSTHFANLDSVKAWRLPTNCMNPRGRNLNVFAVTDELSKQSFRNRATADIAGTDEKNVFHDVRAAQRYAFVNLRSILSKSIGGGSTCSKTMLNSVVRPRSERLEYQYLGDNAFHPAPNLRVAAVG